MLAKIAAADYMSANVITVSAQAETSTAIKKLLDHKITSMPVVDDHGKLLGIFSERDGMRVAVGSAYNQSMEGRVEEFMNLNPVTVKASDSLVDIATKFQDSPMRSFPVFENDSLVGMISRVDVLRALLTIR